jgi:hypothetical protein
MSRFFAKIFLMVFIITGCLTSLSAQLDSTDIRVQNRTYIQLGLGGARATVRDFATSPLFYTGYLGSLSIGISRVIPKRESRIDFRADAGFLEENTALTMFVYRTTMQHLWKLPYLSNKRFKTSWGGMADVSMIERRNPAFGNNSYGLDLLSTIFASAKTRFQFDRKDKKEKRFLFIRYTLKPVQHDLSFQLALPLLNSSYRNGFNHLRGGPEPDNDVFTDYRFRLHSGFRLATEIAYTRHLRNGNGLRLAYLWDVNSNPGHFEKLELAQHTIQFIFLFKANG